MDGESLVHVELHGATIQVGRLWSRTRGARESATFEYDASWLTHPERFALEPALPLTAGPFHTPAGKALFGAMDDTAPDRWGRVLMRRAERRRAEKAGQTPRTLGEADYLLLVDDEARQGVLSTAIEIDDATASLDLALETAQYYGIKASDARMIAADVAKAVSDWRAVATRLNIHSREIDRMASAFVHHDIEKALGQ